jgi:hypothetical protein
MKERSFCCRKRRQQLARSESNATVRQLLAGVLRDERIVAACTQFPWKQGWSSSVGGLLDFDDRRYALLSMLFRFPANLSLSL